MRPRRISDASGSHAARHTAQRPAVIAGDPAFTAAAIA